MDDDAVKEAVTPDPYAPPQAPVVPRAPAAPSPGGTYVVDVDARKVELRLPLCRACNARWTKGVAIRRWLVAALLVASGLILAGVATKETALVVGGGAALAVFLGWAIAAKLPARFVGVQRIDGNRATLTGVAPAAVAVLDLGGPPRKAKKAPPARGEDRAVAPSEAD